ncbi:MAG: ribosome small subunit-dependent GTPase A [Chloroherpetonaceae bacterium]|nr:ribosome small subunit-dependent GTPase A [Chloroherpetonaceae bacterium]
MAKKDIRDRSRTRAEQFLSNRELGEDGTVIGLKSAYFIIRANDSSLHDCKPNRSTYSKNPEDETLLCVGDEVTFKRTNASGGNEFGVGVITTVKERKNKISRARDRRMTRSGESSLVIASNLDNIVIIASAFEPMFRPGLVDRYLVYAGFERLNPLIVVNKMDLCLDKRDHKDVIAITEVYKKLGYQLLYLSVETGKGMDSLFKFLDGKTSVLCGHSGVGKTSIMNFLTKSNFDTKDVSERTLKGSHTTSNAMMKELVEIRGYRFMNKSFIVDTPGIREFGLEMISKLEIRHFFPEFEVYATNCQFSSCLHESEPNCGVKKAVEDKKILKARYESYLNIMATATN